MFQPADDRRFELLAVIFPCARTLRFLVPERCKYLHPDPAAWTTEYQAQLKTIIKTEAADN
jgi:hypothetical protein